jgi:hypothetical protein
MRFLENSCEERDLARLGDEGDFTVDLDDFDHELTPVAQLELRRRFRDANLLRE